MYFTWCSINKTMTNKTDMHTSNNSQVMALCLMFVKSLPTEEH